MPRKRIIRSTGLGYEPDLAWAQVKLREVVEVLNGPTIRIQRAGKNTKSRLHRLRATATEVELRRLVELWASVRRNTAALQRKDPALLDKIGRGRTTLYIDSRSGKAYLDWEPDIHTEDGDRSVALHYFAHLITNPQSAALRGPCPRCGRYFIHTTLRKRQYCSKKCGAAVTAKGALRSFRQRDFEKKRARAVAAIGEWQTVKRGGDCKRWVAARTTLSLNWLTRAEKKGLLAFSRR